MPLTPEEQEQQNSSNFLQSIVDSTNIVEEIDEEKLDEIAEDVHTGYEADKGSREEWEDQQDKYMELAAQVMDSKNYPWPNASNVKYPLLSIAALQFSARAYQALLPNKNVVKGRVIGPDPENEKYERAQRIEKYMSYQLLEEMEEWEESMDRLCLTLPILGNVFKKTYQAADGPVSELILPKDLVVNYYAKSLEHASRKTHVLYYYPNEVVTKIRSGEFIDHDYETGESSKNLEEDHGIYIDDEIQKISEPSNDSTAPVEYLEQHTFLDLDEDGYAEPYIVTLHNDTQKVVRIVARYDVDSIVTNEAGEVVKITPVEYFTNFVFIPDPASGVYGLGLGLLLGPLNEASNTLINQLIDAGKLSNLQSGFIARGIRTRHGSTPLAPGEWRQVETISQDLKSGIVPIPAREPSNVLFQLLGLLLEAGQQLGSVTDLMVGESPGQNQPYSTTQEVLRQGMQVFSSIHKRIHRSLKKEFKKLYRLNKLYLSEEKYFTVLDAKTPEEREATTVRRTDFAGDDTDVIPSSDPIYSSETEKMARSEANLALLQLGTVNPQVATRRILEARDEENIEELLQLPEPQPNFDQQIELKKLEVEEKNLQVDAFRAQAQSARDEAAAMKAMAEAQATAQQQQFELLKQQMEQEQQEMKAQLDIIMQGMKMEQEQEKTNQLREKGAAEKEMQSARVQQQKSKTTS